MPKSSGHFSPSIPNRRGPRLRQGIDLPNHIRLRERVILDGLTLSPGTPPLGIGVKPEIRLAGSEPIAEGQMASDTLQSRLPDVETEIVLTALEDAMVVPSWIENAKDVPGDFKVPDVTHFVVRIGDHEQDVDAWLRDQPRDGG